MKDKYSSKAQAENGIDNTTIMTPLRVKQSILVNSPAAPQASQSDWNEADPTAPAYIKNKPVIPTKTSDLQNDSNFVSDASYVHTDNNYTTTEKTKLSGIEDGAEANVIEEVQVDGVPLTVTNKSVNISGKQDTLISGTTIKTINSQSLLGSGDIEIDPSVHTYEKYLITHISSTSSTLYVDLVDDIQNKNKFVITDTLIPSGKRYYEPILYQYNSNSGNIMIVYRDQNDIYNKIELTVSGTSVTATETTLTTPRDVQINGNSVVDSRSGYAEIQTNGAYSASTNKIATMSDIPAVPTKVSDLQNDSGFITSETDPVYSSSAAATITNQDITNWNVAEANVQSNWNESDTTSDAYIQNKPTIPTKTSDLVNDGPTSSIADYYAITQTQDTGLDVSYVNGVHRVSPIYQGSIRSPYLANLDDLTTKQDTLVSGTNIKTINNQSLLGSGNISVGGGGGSSDYNDLSNKPQINGNTLSGNKTAANLGFATVATSGSYNDLSNKPTIPTVNNGTLTIQRNGSTVATFTANQSGNATANITGIPEFSEGTGVVNRTSGATLEGSSYKKWGRVVQLRINIKSGSSSTSAGNDCFDGKLNRTDLYPIVNTGGMGFQSSSGLIFYVNTAGEINVRVIGATFGTNKTAGGTITYLTAS